MEFYLPYGLDLVERVNALTRETFPWHDPRERKLRWGNYGGFFFGMDEDTEIRAVASGIVIGRSINRRMGLGKNLWYEEIHSTNLVVVKHDDGSVAEYQHIFPSKLRKGQRVMQGQPLGLLGGWQGGPHLHLEITFNDDQIECRLELPFGY